MFILSTYCVCNYYLLDSRMGSLFWLCCHTLCEYALCLWPHRRDIKGQSELTETDVTCLSFHSGGIGASTGHRGGCLDQRPGSVLNPITHPYRWKRCASAFTARRERHEGREIKSFYMKWRLAKCRKGKCLRCRLSSSRWMATVA